MNTIDLAQYQGFDWDKGNQDKNLNKHGVSYTECEQVFFNDPLVLGDDLKHSDVEPRFYVFGQTDQGRKLYLVFTGRKNLIRVISARDMDKKEREFYEKIEGNS